MELRFPKARLFAHNSLSSGASCFEVLLQAVVDAGLLTDASTASLNAETKLHGQCGSLNAARKILESYLKERHPEDISTTLTDKAINQIKADVDLYEKTAASRNADNCPAYQEGTSCREIAPVVLDLLLQQLMRH